MEFLSPPLPCEVDHVDTPLSPDTIMTGPSTREVEPFPRLLETNELLQITMKLIASTNTPIDIELYKGSIFSINFMVACITSLLAQHETLQDGNFTQKLVIDDIEYFTLKSWIESDFLKEAQEKEMEIMCRTGLALSSHGSRHGSDMYP